MTDRELSHSPSNDTQPDTQGLAQVNMVAYSVSNDVQQDAGFRIDKRIVAAVIVVLSLVPAWGIYSHMKSDVKTERERNQLLQQHHATEIAAVQAIADARVQRERDKGLWADYVTPAWNWISGSDVSVDAGPVSIEIKPKN